MLRLKGQTELGEWVEFYVGDIKDANYDYTGIRIFNGDNINDIITATIQLADDPHSSDALIKASGKAVLSDEELPGMWSNSDFTGGACVAEESSRYTKVKCKAMLEEIRQRVNALEKRETTGTIFVMGSAYPTLICLVDLQSINEIISELEAKL